MNSLFTVCTVIVNHFVFAQDFLVITSSKRSFFLFQKRLLRGVGFANAAVMQNN